MESGTMSASFNANGTSQKPAQGFNPNFTQSVIDAMGPKTSPRMREVMTSFIRHTHDFAREVNLTVDEWMQGVNLINQAGKMSDEKRNEGQLMCDVIGLESLVDEITYTLAAQAEDTPTATAILGPFWRHDTPRREKDSSIVITRPDDGEVTYLHGRVLDATTKQPVKGAKVDVWQASTNGLYEQQDKDQVDHNLRGVFETDENGEYALYCLRPTSYPVPDDGPAGKLLKLLDRHPMRPAHIHFIVTHNDFKPVTTQIFDSKDPHLEDDSVFAVKDSLIVDFTELKGNDQAKLELEYDIALAPQTTKNGA